MKHLISVDSLSKEELNHIISLAEDIAMRPQFFRNALSGKTLGLYFQKPSTRMRFSLQSGMFQMGGCASFFKTSETHMSRGESIADTARVLSGYMDIIAIRSKAHQDIVDFADFGSIPVLNALSAMHYPAMAITSMFTLKQHFNELEGKKLTFIGDGNNICHSLLQICPLSGVDITVISPEMYEPNPVIIEKAEKTAEQHSTRIVISNDMSDVRDSDIIYTDVWTSLGMESEEQERLEAFKNYRVTGRIVEQSGGKPVILHAMPVRRGEEIDSELISDSLIFKNAGNMLHVSKSILHYLLKED